MHCGGLSEALPKRSHSPHQSGGVEQGQQTLLPTHGPITHQFRVTKDQAIDPGQVVVAEDFGKVGGTTCDEHQLETGLLDFSCVRPELGRLLATEYSAKVAQPDEDGRIELRQAVGLAILVMQLNFHLLHNCLTKLKSSLAKISTYYPGNVQVYP